MERIKRLLVTVGYLTLTQIRYQLKYRFLKPKSLKTYREGFRSVTKCLRFLIVPPVYASYISPNCFTFLNKTKDFKLKIDWDYREFGALWNYNLQYGNYLLQEDISVSEKLTLIRSLYNTIDSGGLALEPYPVSVRAINIMRLICSGELKEQDILENLYAELNFLSKRWELHLLGNHLLENAFAMCLGGAFFGKKDWRDKAKGVLYRELQEQILKDGGHFELSPMYHKIVFYRLLELIDWYSEYEEKDNKFYNFCREKAQQMRGWLENIKFQNNDIPLFNDSAEGVAYDTKFLLSYADELGIEPGLKKLSDSGYRSYDGDNYEVKVDVAQLGPKYQPGHSHADTLSFILYYKGEPLFVEQGTSTYQIGARRDLERSTEAHNTVVINDKNQSDVWGGFRVGKRATTTVLRDEERLVNAQHDGYEDLGVIHKRKYRFSNDIIYIYDELEGIVENAKAYFHLHPGCSVEVEKGTVVINNDIVCKFEGWSDIKIEPYDYANTYNVYKKADRVIVAFRDILKTTIKFIK